MTIFLNEVPHWVQYADVDIILQHNVKKINIYFKA